MRTPSRLTKFGIAVGAVSAGLLIASPAAATWSVVGVDPETGEVGVAVASCVDIVDFFDVEQTLPLVALAPGSGAGVSQADFNDLAPPEMARVLADGSAPADVIAAVTDASFDAEAEFRQHGVVTLDGQAAAFTGSENPTVALDRQAANVTAQGNTLVSNAVIEEALAAFVAADDSPLADRLVAALWAGSEQGGDARCGEQTALFASVVVAGATDDPGSPATLVTITAEAGSANPVELLAEQFGVTSTDVDSDPEENATSDTASSAEQAEPTTEAAETADGDDTADDSGGNGALIAVGAAVIAALVAAVIVVSRRRSQK